MSKASLTEHHGRVSDVKIDRYTWVLPLCLCLCLCVSVSVSLRCVLRVVCCGGGGRRVETNRTIRLLIPARASLKIAETEQLCQVERMIGGIGDMLFSIYSHTENVQDPRVSLVNLWSQVITLRGQILASGTDDATLRVLCCVLCPSP